MSATCVGPDCQTRASYNILGGKPYFCKKHKKEGMVIVIGRFCENPDCRKQPSYNVIGGKPRFCKNHKIEGMINVICASCENPDCRKQPSYNVIGGKARFCKNHKIEGMINVISASCEEPDCRTRPSYNVTGGKPRFCKTHKKEGMVDVRSVSCEEPDCQIQASYNVPGGRPRFCNNHKNEGMVDVRSVSCKLCPTFIQPKKYNGYCYRCFIHTYPDNQIVRNHKTKERCVADYIRESFPGFSITFDKPITGGCSKKRPDIHIDFGTHTLVVEIDENQHAAYDCTCENKRLMMLFQDCGGTRPMVMVRFNPDDYITHEQKKVTSCWGHTQGMGLCTVKKTKKKEWEQRLETLRKNIQYVSEHVPTKEIDVIHLYYDGWSL